jgi:hypothetical protein
MLSRSADCACTQEAMRCYLLSWVSRSQVCRQMQLTRRFFFGWFITSTCCAQREGSAHRNVSLFERIVPRLCDAVTLFGNWTDGTRSKSRINRPRPQISFEESQNERDRTKEAFWCEPNNGQVHGRRCRGLMI